MLLVLGVLPMTRVGRERLYLPLLGVLLLALLLLSLVRFALMLLVELLLLLLLLHSCVRVRSWIGPGRLLELVL